MSSNGRWRVVLCLLNATVVGADTLHLVVLATDTTSQRVFHLVALGVATFLSLACALSVWLVPQRRVGCLMAVNALVFLAHALSFLPLGIVMLSNGHLEFGLLELSFAAQCGTGCVFCRIYSVKVREEVERKDALEISYEQQKVEQLA
ncbi:hypothetical protein PHMEG_00024254 [Phytophthora megakarya]|uniref:Transmembrane protein n=1 Tax=Phytophthora megakarya TaxID=4795 RepID=A0A225VFM9_9STRA|nr:hypothetical protein PHMEG_00024254 [Phytophthora megakarya]